MTIEQELLALTDDEGFIKPRIVVEWARGNPASELHGRFEWDDARAAEKYRLDQARQLISVYVRTDDGQRATISLVQDRNADGGYRKIEQVMSNAELRAMALRQAMREFNRWRQRYEHLSELAKVFSAAAAVEAPPTETDVAA